MTTDQTPAASHPSHRESTKSRQRIALVVGVVVLVALVTWLVTRGDDGDDKTKAQNSGVQVGVPTVLSEAGLRAFGRAQTTPVYWAGPLANRRYELTQTSGGRYYVRYLTPRADVGDAAPRFLTVGTYPGTNAYGALQSVGRRETSERVTTQSGALVVYDKNRPTSVYFAFRNQNFQVEVYDPRSTRARRFVLEGKVQRLQ